MPGDDDSDGFDEQINGVVARVPTAFRQSASADEMLDLRRSKPSIPRDIDRALLIDASEALDMYDVSERIRHQLRTRVWEQFENQS